MAAGPLVPTGFPETEERSLVDSGLSRTTRSTLWSSSVQSGPSRLIESFDEIGAWGDENRRLWESQLNLFWFSVGEKLPT